MTELTKFIQTGKDGNFRLFYISEDKTFWGGMNYGKDFKHKQIIQIIDISKMNALQILEWAGEEDEP